MKFRNLDKFILKYTDHAIIFSGIQRGWEFHRSNLCIRMSTRFKHRYGTKYTYMYCIPENTLTVNHIMDNANLLGIIKSYRNKVIVSKTYAFIHDSQIGNKVIFYTGGKVVKKIHENYKNHKRFEVDYTYDTNGKIKQIAKVLTLQ